MGKRWFFFVIWLPPIELKVNYFLNGFLCFKSLPSTDIRVKLKYKILAYNSEPEFAIQLDSRLAKCRTNGNISIHNPRDGVAESSLDRFCFSLFFQAWNTFLLSWVRENFCLVIWSQLFPVLHLLNDIILEWKSNHYFDLYNSLWSPQ